MKYLRLGPEGSERLCVLIDKATVVDISDVTSIDDVLAAPSDPGLTALVAARVRGRATMQIGSERIGAPILRPHQIVGVGLNFADHAREAGSPIPEEPLIFSKSPNSLTGPGDDIIIPRGSVKTDYEVELGIVIGRRAHDLADEAAAEAAIAGYALVNDVSEREFQNERWGQFMKGKSAPTFCPVGPWLVTSDELDVGRLSMTCAVNGELRQNGSTETMIFRPATIVHYLSRFMVLEPGDLITTGTPPGVGLGMSPPRYLRAGDLVELAIDGLGMQTHRMVDAADARGVQNAIGRLE